MEFLFELDCNYLDMDKNANHQLSAISKKKKKKGVTVVETDLK